MKKRMTRRVSALAAVAVVAMVTLTTSPALASPSAPATTSRVLIIGAHGAVRPASNCTWVAPNGTVLGTIICEYGQSQVFFPNGTEEGFAVGTSHAVWTAWNNTSGTWFRQSMGSSAYSPVIVAEQNGWQVEIAMEDSHGTVHCDFRGGGQTSGWTGWSTNGC